MKAAQVECRTHATRGTERGGRGGSEEKVDYLSITFLAGLLDGYNSPSCPVLETCERPCQLWL